MAFRNLSDVTTKGFCHYPKVSLDFLNLRVIHGLLVKPDRTENAIRILVADREWSSAVIGFGLASGRVLQLQRLDFEEAL
jgi:hypothetical protein